VRSRHVRYAAAVLAVTAAAGAAVATGLTPLKEGPLTDSETATTTTTSTTTTSTPTTSTTTTTTTAPTARPKPLVIDGTDRVIDGGTYESIVVKSANVEIKNVVIDNAGYTGDPLQRGGDCLYVVTGGSVRFHDSVCRNAHRQGVAVISTRLNATVQVERVKFENVSRFVVDLEPNTPSQHIHSFMIGTTEASGDGLGWLIRHSGCCDRVISADGNTYRGHAMPSGQLGPGTYGRCKREPAAIPC
jgi:hypothetical protein